MRRLRRRLLKTLNDWKKGYELITFQAVGKLLDENKRLESLIAQYRERNIKLQKEVIKLSEHGKLRDYTLCDICKDPTDRDGVCYNGVCDMVRKERKKSQFYEDALVVISSVHSKSTEYHRELALDVLKQDLEGEAADPESECYYFRGIRGE